MIQTQGHFFACFFFLVGNLLVCENILSGVICFLENSLEKVWPASPQGDNLHNHGTGLQTKAIDPRLFILTPSWEEAQRVETNSSAKNKVSKLRSTSALYFWGSVHLFMFMRLSSQSEEESESTPVP